MATLARLLDDRSLGLVPVVDRRRGENVRWVATSELDDPAPFLEGGEVLLTTGLETAAWSEEWDGYVRRLADAGVVAIGVAVGLTYAAVPDALARACRGHGVDLFEVPRDTRFVAISRALAALLQQEDDAATRAALESQRALTQAALREDDPAALVRELAGVGGLAAVVGARGGLVLGPFGDRADLLDLAQVDDAVVKMRPQGLRAAASLSSPAGTLLVQPIGVSDRPTQYLVAGFAGRVTETERSTVATAVALLGLAEQRRRASRETDRRLRTRAVELLAAGDLRTAAVLLGAGSGPRPRLPRTPVVLRCRGTLPRLEDGLELLEGVPALAAIAPGEVAELVAVVRAAHATELADRLRLTGLRVGIGEPVRREELRTSHVTAGEALALTSSSVPVAAWADHVRGGVLTLLEGGRAEAFASSWLAPLDGDEVLLDTLDSFLRHHGSVLKVADDLAVHRNTVRHRVQRLEELLGRSLADPQVRVDAWVALRAHRDR
ncbi:PucR family transcriptional regulator [Nocardioides jiangxiensis]|uniref:PucR family transcriptional regulator n=1 Tax=Nocardioides jiangxiensis TaxID=3064524 RepID=A0ABT9B1Z4_9ACTN|nr:PucR family transcriptional regulator [Nocardioides sp. WY-20]MDO7868228.1 PucR family transcriptional regulator [Nocardioides sp. WY-20]